MSDKDEKDDLTRIENLKEFLHDEELDQETEDFLKQQSKQDMTSTSTGVVPTFDKTSTNVKEEVTTTGVNFEGTQAFQIPEGLNDPTSTDIETEAPQIEEADEPKEPTATKTSVQQVNLEPSVTEVELEAEAEPAIEETSTDFESDGLESSDDTSESTTFESDEFGSDDFESADFESSDDTSQSTTFESDEFGSDDFESPDFENESPDFENTDFESAESEDFENLEEDSPEIEEEVASNTQQFEDFASDDDEDSGEASEQEEIESSLPESPEFEETTLDSELPSEEETTPVEEQPPEVPGEEVVEDVKIIPKSEFKDVHEFAENITYGDLGQEGNPPFSIIIKNIKYNEDAEHMADLLHEYKVVEDKDETLKSMSRGSYLVPRLSEYAAIYLCHKLREFDVDLLMGLSEEVHSPKSFEEDNKGLISKRSPYQNYSHYYNLVDEDFELGSIILTTLSSLDGYEIKEHLGIVSEHKVINMAEYEETPPELPGEYQSDFSQNDLSPISELHQKLSEALRPHAFKLKGNAIIGIQYNMHPLGEGKTEVTCSGNAVIAVREEHE
jgi:uncharacterized protein YbjQ (UPF0145 family)